MSLQDWPEPVGADMIDNVLGKDVDGLEPAGLQREGLGGASQYTNRARSNRSRAANLPKAKPRNCRGDCWRRESRFSYSH
jgi:hypothetical protein